MLNPLTHKKKGIGIVSLSPWDSAEGTWREVVVESKRVSPADRAVYNLDFAARLKSWPRRHRRIINALASGERTMAVAKKFGISEGRVSQWRKTFPDSWERFQSGNADAAAA